METNVSHGCYLIIPLTYILQVDNTLLAPMTVIEQKPITDSGEVLLNKYWLIIRVKFILGQTLL